MVKADGPSPVPRTHTGRRGSTPATCLLVSPAPTPCSTVCVPAHMHKINNCHGGLIVLCNPPAKAAEILPSPCFSRALASYHFPDPLQSWVHSEPLMAGRHIHPVVPTHRAGVGEAILGWCRSRPELQLGMGSSPSGALLLARISWHPHHPTPSFLQTLCPDDVCKACTLQFLYKEGRGSRHLLPHFKYGAGKAT